MTLPDTAIRAKAAALLTEKLVDQGKIIEGGWVGLKAAWLHPDAPPEQVDEMRKAFFAGAQHLYASIMTVLDSGEEPTDRDMRRLANIATELDDFGKTVAFELPTEGSA